jgi:selenocysteine lyase/cysteine desulfurase
MTQKAAARPDWREAFFEFDGVTFLNAAGQAPMPRVAARALQQAMEWKKFPHLLADSAYFELPDRVRALVAQLVAGRPHEVALTAGATGGLAVVAAGLDWKPEDEVLLAHGEFPAHFCTWRPLADSGRLRLKIVRPRERFITAEDFLAAIGPRTRLVSAALVRFDDASRLDAVRVAEACRAVGAHLLLDVSQCAGALPIEARALGADFLVCAGYKWLLSPYGTGFFWIREELIEQMRPQPFYWMALEGAERFHSLVLDEDKIAPAPRHARRWDAPETASYFNLAAMEASLGFILEVGPQTILDHNNRLLELLIERLPRDRCILASPRNAARRGPFVCVSARAPEKTCALFEKLRAERIFAALRENALRIAPHLYNTERDIERLVMALAT